MKLSTEEAELVAAEATSAAQVLGEPRRNDAIRLADAAAAGEVPPELQAILAEVVAASVKGGRARKLYKAEGERQLAGVLGRTPAGKAHQEGLAEVNTALGALAGRTLQGVRVAMRRPGTYTVNLQCDGVALTLVTTADGVAVDSLAT